MMILLGCTLHTKYIKFIIFHFVGSKIITKKNNGKKKKEPAGKRFYANLKSLINNTDNDKNNGDEEIDVTVDIATPKTTKRPREGKLFKIYL